MKLTPSFLNDAVARNIISAQQAEQLGALAAEQDAATPGFRAAHILYYLGGMVAIGAMSLFMTLGWEQFGGSGLLAIALAYAAGGLALTEYFLKRLRLTIPAGIAATFVVVLTPLAVYGLQNMLGWWSGDEAYRDFHYRIDWRWMLMELATLAVGAVMLWRYRLPFLVMPVAVTLWYMSMDIAPFLFGGNDYDWALRKIVSTWFGLGMVLLAFWVDLRTRHSKDYAFWLYLFGVLAFWGGLSWQHSDSELNKLIYCAINLAMIAVGAMLSRRVFAVFGGFGVAGYLGHLADKVFQDSMLFPLALTFIGLGVIFLGVLWQRHEATISQRLRGWLPPSLRELVERRG